MEESLAALRRRASSEFERIYPLDAGFDTLADVPAEIRENKRYKDHGDFSIQGLTERIEADFGEQALDIVVHSLANGPEVKKPLSRPAARATSPRSASAPTRTCRWCSASCR